MAAFEVMFPLLLSFGSFAVFVWVARCAVASPSFRPDSSPLTRLVHACVAERPAHAKRCQTIPQKEQPGAAGAQAPDSFAKDAGRLALCTAGIQVSYLVWGLMQERSSACPIPSPYPQPGPAAIALTLTLVRVADPVCGV